LDRHGARPLRRSKATFGEDSLKRKK
jgi:hypothetical protein